MPVSAVLPAPPMSGQNATAVLRLVLSCFLSSPEKATLGGFTATHGYRYFAVDLLWVVCFNVILHEVRRISTRHSLQHGDGYFLAQETTHFLYEAGGHFPACSSQTQSHSALSRYLASTLVRKHHYRPGSWTSPPKMIRDIR